MRRPSLGTSGGLACKGGAVASATAPRITYLTPSYVGDYTRFALLRESMAAYGITTPHVVVVPPEDVALFASIRHREGLLVTGYPALPVQRAVAPSAWQRAWVPWGARARRWHSGWVAQQIVKHEAPCVETSSWVCVDSDCVFLRTVDESEFFDAATALPKLFFHAIPEGVAEREYKRGSARALGLPLEVAETPEVFTGPLAPMHRAIVDPLHDHLEQRSQTPWWWAMARSRATDYTIQALYVRHLAPAASVATEAAVGGAFLAVVDQTFTTRIRRMQERGAPVVSVHSKIGVVPAHYAPQLRALWSG